MEYYRAAPLLTLALLIAGGCGKKEKDGDQTQTPPPAGVDTTKPAGNEMEIRMTGDGTTTALYEPDSVTITPATTLKFVNVSGWPHNISFWPDSIPAGADSVLTKAMKNQVDVLVGEFLTEPNASYSVSFAGTPPGVYKGYCQPHLALGMRILITVQ